MNTVRFKSQIKNFLMGNGNFHRITYRFYEYKRVRGGLDFRLNLISKKPGSANIVTN